MRIMLNWTTAHADAQDTASRQMRAAGRKKWSRADYNACAARLQHLAIVFYRENYEVEYGPIDLREAWMALASTRGRSCIGQ